MRLDELCPGADMAPAQWNEAEAAFQDRFEAVGLKLAIVMFILNANLMEKYPGFWNRFVSFLHLTEAIWRPFPK